MQDTSNAESSRVIRVFISSTFRDMEEERNELMTHCWPELRKFCRERYVDFVEVDLRWGISEEQSQRDETLKLCLNEIQKCRPFFIGMLGERYGNVPENASFTGDLLEEQKWLREKRDKSYTELEILHGVLNDPEMMSRSFFYFRDTEYGMKRGEDFRPESPEFARKLHDLKERIRNLHDNGKIHLRGKYESPSALAKHVLEDLEKAIEARFPLEKIPDALVREAMEHESFAESRRKTYIGRLEYYNFLIAHTNAEGTPLVITGASGGGKTALLANWVKTWRKDQPEDFVYQHYIGGTNQSADHWSLMNRLMSEIKNWTGDPSELPKTHDDMLRDFGSWLARLRLKAEQKKVRAVLIIDALNQLEDKDYAHVLGWLPEFPFFGRLRMVVSTLDGPILEVLKNRKWETFEVKTLQSPERKELVREYLKRFSKELEEKYLTQIVSVPTTENPLYLKIFIDELRVTGTHQHLAEKISYYLSSPDITSLLDKIMDRYETDYEKEQKGLVSETLGLICSARRGLSEPELLELLKPSDKPQLPQAIWSPLRSALEEFLMSKNGILNFSHVYIKDAVERKFVPDIDAKDEFQLKLADYFEKVEINERSCDELVWLLEKTESFEKLKGCLLDLNRFGIIYGKSRIELRKYWTMLGEERSIGQSYLSAHRIWTSNHHRSAFEVSKTSFLLATFLQNLALYNLAEQLYLWIIALEKKYNTKETILASIYSTLASLYIETFRLKEAEALLYDALDTLLQETRNDEKNILSDRLASILVETNRLNEAHILYTTTLNLRRRDYGENHLLVAISLNNLGLFYLNTNHKKEAENYLLRALKIEENWYGKDHPEITSALNNLGEVYRATDRLDEAELAFSRTLNIKENCNGKNHHEVAGILNNIAEIYRIKGRFDDAELLYQRIEKILKLNFGEFHPRIAHTAYNYALLLLATNRPYDGLKEIKTGVEILWKISKINGQIHSDLRQFVSRFHDFLLICGYSQIQALDEINSIAPDLAKLSFRNEV